MAVALSVKEVTQIAEETVQAERAGVDVVGVMVTDGGNYAEVLLRVQDCQKQPCRMALGVFRDVGESALRADIAHQVRQHVDEHAGLSESGKE